jgi:hypothetical protein
MTETQIQELQRSSLAMFLGLSALYELHAEIQMDANDGPELACEHCSQLAGAVVVYPCPSIQILLTDFPDMVDEATSELSEPAESAEPSA